MNGDAPRRAGIRDWVLAHPIVLYLPLPIIVIVRVAVYRTLGHLVAGVVSVLCLWWIYRRTLGKQRALDKEAAQQARAANDR